MDTFEQFRRSAPPVPDETCPYIDSVNSELDNAIDIIKNVIKSNGSMEDIRRANSDLRNLALFWRASAEELADMVDDLESKLEKLQEEIDQLQNVS